MNKVDLRYQAAWDHKRRVLRELGLPILFGAMVLFLSATILLGMNIATMRASAAGIQNTQQILVAVAEAEAGVVGEQLTVRSYALTGDARFLEFQDAERSRLAKAMDRLAALVVSDPGGRARVRALREQTNRHTALWDGLKGVGPDRAAIVARAILDPANRDLMLRTRWVLAVYRADQVRSLGERQDELTRQLSRSFVLAIGIIVTAFVLGGIGLVAGQFRLPLRAG